MRKIVLILATSLVAACASTGGDILGPKDRFISPDNAVIFFSTQIADNTRFQTCSVLAGKSPATATWFSWAVADSGPTLLALEVPVPEYRFFRFACAYSGLTLSTSVEGPKLDLSAGKVVYLGRLIVQDTEFGSAAGYRRMPTAVRLGFEDQRVSDIEDLTSTLPFFAGQDVSVDIPEQWNSLAMNRLRPYNRGLRVVQAPTAAAFNNARLLKN